MKPLPSFALGDPLILATRYTSASGSYRTDSGVENPTSSRRKPSKLGTSLGSRVGVGSGSSMGSAVAVGAGVSYVGSAVFVGSTSTSVPGVSVAGAGVGFGLQAENITNAAINTM